MPQKMNMILSNGYTQPSFKGQINNTASLGVAQMPSSAFSSQKAPSALNAPILARIHNVRPGCGSCGGH